MAAKQARGVKKLMVNKLCWRKDVASKFTDGQTIMVGGFAKNGVPNLLLDVLVQSKVKNLTIIASGASDPGLGLGKVFRSRQVARFITSHTGTNAEACRLISKGEIKLELCPQGTLLERIRCGGVGLGGVLLKTGMGTVAEEGMQKMEVDGETYLLAKPLRADIALVHAWRADEVGNLVFRGTSANFNPLVAMAADLVIADAEEIVPVGSIDPDHVDTPGVFGNMVLAETGK
jgi:acetate CoA/acetoacetate CoA-transferase alpha subunit